MNERDIFIQALQIEDAAQQADFLNEACGTDEALRKRVQSLLQSHERAESFLESPPAPDATIDQPITEREGTVIGPYKLLEQIGEGGMGVVYMADQTEPVERRVALKIIKPGMDTREIIARFEAERQALAMMDHPNIAKVLDAGTTDSPSPLVGEGRGGGHIAAVALFSSWNSSKAFRSQNTATRNISPPVNGSTCFSPFAMPFNTRIRKESSTAT